MTVAEIITSGMFVTILGVMIYFVRQTLAVSEKRWEERFSLTEKHWDERFDGLERRVDKMETTLDEVRKEVSAIKSDVSEIKGFLLGFAQSKEKTSSK